jgi:hypothetical protein
MDGGWMGDGWGMDGGWMGDGWGMDGGWMGDGWEMDVAILTCVTGRWGFRDST